MLQRSLRGDIQVLTDVRSETCRVAVDLGELDLAILNLGVNARDAMPGGGTLTLRVRAMNLDGAPDGLRGEFAAFSWATPAAASRPTCSGGCSIRSSPPRKSARAPGSA